MRERKMKRIGVRHMTKRKLIALFMIAVVVTGAFIGYKILRTTMLLYGLKDELKKINTIYDGSKRAFIKLHLEKKYTLDKIKGYGDTAANIDDSQECLKKIREHEELFESLANEMTTAENLKDDWYSESDYLKPPKQEELLIDFNRAQPNFRDQRCYAKTIQCMVRLSVAQGKLQRAAKLLQTNLSHARHFISSGNSLEGMALIDAMIAIAILGNCEKSVTKSGILQQEWNDNLFDLVKTPLEEADTLFPLVGPSLRVERSVIPSFIRNFQKNADKSILTADFPVDTQWLNGRLDYFYPPQESFTLPYVEFKPKLSIYEERLMNMSKETTGKGFVAKGLFSPFKAAVEVMLAISVPNFMKAQERESQCHSNLRAVYLAFALKEYKRLNNSYPRKLSQLSSLIDTKMSIDPYFGVEYVYSSDGTTAKLESIRDEARHSIVFDIK